MPQGLAGRLCLAIESSNPPSGAEVALGMLGKSSAATSVLATESLREVGRNEDDLLPAIDRLFRSARVKATDLGAVAVSIGPGGYTALRIACAAGKMVAESVGARCHAVPTALSVAHSLLQEPGTSLKRTARFGVALAGKDESTYLTLFGPGSWGSWHRGAEIPVGHLVTAADFPLEEVEHIVADRYLPAPISGLLTSRGIPIVAPRFSAASCLQVASALDSIDPVALVPFYPREPDAVTLWRRRKHS